MQISPIECLCKVTDHNFSLLDFQRLEMCFRSYSTRRVKSVKVTVNSENSASSILTWAGFDIELELYREEAMAKKVSSGSTLSHRDLRRDHLA